MRSPPAAVLLLCVMLASAAFGCSSSKKETRSQKMLEGFEQTKAALVEANYQVDATLTALMLVRQMSTTGGANLNEAFTHYKDMVAQLEKQAEKARSRAQAMRENVDTNIMTWQQEMAKIKDPSIKASLEERQDAVRTNYNLVRMYADDARKAYQPFLRSNKDMVRALSIDLSAASVASLSTSMEKTNAMGATLKQKIYALQRALGNIERGLSPQGM